MKKFFQEPEMSIQNFAVEDVITTSNWTPGENEGEGDTL